MMDISKLYEILNETTIQLRKGSVVEDRSTELLEVVEVNAMPHESDAGDDLEMVDLEFLVIGVDREKAETRRTEIIDFLDNYPVPTRLAEGPSYIAVGADIGDQGAAFQLFALGKVLGLWDVITPATMGFEGEAAREMAGSGFVMITGYRQEAA